MDKNIKRVKEVLESIDLDTIKKECWEKVLNNIEVQIWLSCGGDEKDLYEIFERVWGEQC